MLRPLAQQSTDGTIQDIGVILSAIAVALLTH
jgi:hypothetical protein